MEAYYCFIKAFTLYGESSSIKCSLVINETSCRKLLSICCWCKTQYLQKKIRFLLLLLHTTTKKNILLLDCTLLTMIMNQNLGFNIPSPKKSNANNCCDSFSQYQCQLACSSECSHWRNCYLINLVNQENYIFALVLLLLPAVTFERVEGRRQGQVSEARPGNGTGTQAHGLLGFNGITNVATDSIKNQNSTQWTYERFWDWYHWYKLK